MSFDKNGICYAPHSTEYVRAFGGWDAKGLQNIATEYGAVGARVKEKGRLNPSIRSLDLTANDGQQHLPRCAKIWALYQAKFRSNRASRA